MSEGKTITIELTTDELANIIVSLELRTMYFQGDNGRDEARCKKLKARLGEIFKKEEGIGLRG